jgi:Putative DNA-binding domain
MSAVATEATRQQALLAAIAGAPGAGPVPGAIQLARGLAIYRANAALLAERALAARHPLLLQMLGDEPLALLARALWQAHPPRRGDVAQWGHELPAFIEAQADLAPWPWLADVARFELLRADCEAAADAVLEAGTVQLLAELDPAELHLELMPALRLMRSDWPLCEIVAAHAPSLDAAARSAALAALDERIGAWPRAEPEYLVVARQGWRAEPASVASADWRWMDALRRGLALDRALAEAGDDFDVGAWLGRALQSGWFRRVSAPRHRFEE